MPDRSVAAAVAAALRQLAHRARRRLLREGLLDLLEVAAVAGVRRDLQLRASCGDVLGSVARVRVVAQPLGPAAALGLLLDRLEHPRQIVRVVAGPRHQLRAQEVGLLLVLAAVLEQQRAEAELAALLDRRSDAPADHRAGDRAGERAELRVLGLGRVGGAVPQQDVRQLVGHHAGHLALGRRRFDHAAIHEHRPARQGEGVDVLEVDGLERVLELGVVELGRGLRHELAPDAGQVVVDLPVLDDGELLAHLRRGLAPELHVVFGLVLVLRRLDRRLGGDASRRERRAAAAESAGFIVWSARCRWCSPAPPREPGR